MEKVIENESVHIKKYLNQTNGMIEFYLENQLLNRKYFSRFSKQSCGKRITEKYTEIENQRPSIIQYFLKENKSIIKNALFNHPNLSDLTHPNRLKVCRLVYKKLIQRPSLSHLPNLLIAVYLVKKGILHQWFKTKKGNYSF